MSSKVLKKAMQATHFDTSSPDHEGDARLRSSSHATFIQPPFIEIRSSIPYKNSSVVNLKPSLDSSSFSTESSSNYRGISVPPPQPIRARPSAVSFSGYGIDKSHYSPKLVNSTKAGDTAESSSLYGITNNVTPFNLVTGELHAADKIYIPKSFARKCARVAPCNDLEILAWEPKTKPVKLENTSHAIVAVANTKVPPLRSLGALRSS